MLQDGWSERTEGCAECHYAYVELFACSACTLGWAQRQVVGKWPKAVTHHAQWPKPLRAVQARGEARRGTWLTIAPRGEQLPLHSYPAELPPVVLVATAPWLPQVGLVSPRPGCPRSVDAMGLGSRTSDKSATSHVSARWRLSGHVDLHNARCRAGCLALGAQGRCKLRSGGLRLLAFACSRLWTPNVIRGRCSQHSPLPGLARRQDGTVRCSA